MHLVVIGLNHRTAPVELREKLSIGDDALPNALADLRAKSPVSECLILCTCNRTEIYACTQSKSDDECLIAWMSDFFGVDAGSLSPHLYSHAGHKAAEHLFYVAAGIDSMVVGEAQILGQVKAAHTAAIRAGCTGPVLNSLFQHAISVGKRARSETAIGRGAFSVGSVAVQLAGSIVDELKGRTILILGAGKMAELAMTHLVSAGASAVLVANRTHEKAVTLAARLGGRAVSFDDLPSALKTADIVITSTGADKPIVTRPVVAAAMLSRRGRPMFLIDIAVPRDIEPAVGDIDNVFVYNIDDLQAVVQADMAGRRAEIEKVEAIVAHDVQRFAHRFRTFDAVPVITALRERFEDIRQTELVRLKRKLRGLSDAELEEIDAATRSIVNRICHHPMTRIKDYAASPDPPVNLEAVCELFGICPDDEKQIPRDARNDTHGAGNDTNGARDDVNEAD